MEESSADKSNWNILIKNIRRKFLDTVCENHENETLSRVIVSTEKEDFLLKTICPECVRRFKRIVNSSIKRRKLNRRSYPYCYK